MADATTTVTVNSYPDGLDMGINKGRIFGSVAIASGNYVTNGLPIVFSGIVPGLSGDVVDVVFESIGGNVYTYDRTNKTMRMYSAYATEYGNGVALGAGIYGDTVYFQATVNKV
jgi:hypothetical protein